MNPNQKYGVWFLGGNTPGEIQAELHGLLNASNGCYSLDNTEGRVLIVRYDQMSEEQVRKEIGQGLEAIFKFPPAQTFFQTQTEFTVEDVLGGELVDSAERGLFVFHEDMVGSANFILCAHPDHPENFSLTRMHVILHYDSLDLQLLARTHGERKVFA